MLSYPEFLIAILMLGAAVAWQLRSRATSKQRPESTSSELHSRVNPAVDSAPHIQLPRWLTTSSVSVSGGLPARYCEWLSKNQTWAGWRSPSAFNLLVTVKFALACACTLLTFCLSPLLVLPICVIIYFVPDLIVVTMARRRQSRMRASLPQALDLMVLCVDAGLGLDATLQRIAVDETPLAKELNDELLMLGRDILLGMDRERAYFELYRRTGLDELRSLGSALNQSAKLGLSIARVLRAQSEFLHMKLSQRAEERAAKLPIYLAFPLWFCIMPTLLVILLAPSLIMFFNSLGADLFR